MAKRKKYELKKSAKVMLCLIFAGLSAGMLYSSAQELQTMLQLKESIANDQNEIADLKQQESDLSEEKTKLEDPEYLARCRDNALRTIEEKFEVHKMARATFGVYEKALGR